MPKAPAKTAYVLLFRGVGGATQLPTAPLREALAEAGFENVATYINSGNAVLRSRLSRAKVVAAVAETCRDRFGFTKAIFAPTLEEWSALIDNNPFPRAVATPTWRADVKVDSARVEPYLGTYRPEAGALPYGDGPVTLRWRS